MMDILKKQDYYITYKYKSNTCVCTIKALSEQECRALFHFRYDQSCLIEKVQTHLEYLQSNPINFAKFWANEMDKAR